MVHSREGEDMGSKSRWKRWNRRRVLLKYLVVALGLGFAVVLWSISGAGFGSDADLLEEAKPEGLDVTLHETEIGFRVSRKYCSVRALRCGSPGNPLVLLLHGARYTSETWKKIGTYPELCSKGFAAVGIDLPGYGGTVDDCGADKAAFMNALISNLAYSSSSKITIVSPSMSGAFTAAALTQPRLVQHISSIVWVAPVGIKSLDVYPPSIQALIIYGRKDPIGSGSKEKLMNFPTHTVTVLE